MTILEHRSPKLRVVLAEGSWQEQILLQECIYIEFNVRKVIPHLCETAFTLGPENDLQRLNDSEKHFACGLK